MVGKLLINGRNANVGTLHLLSLATIIVRLDMSNRLVRKVGWLEDTATNFGHLDVPANGGPQDLVLYPPYHRAHILKAASSEIS